MLNKNSNQNEARNQSFKFNNSNSVESLMAHIKDIQKTEDKTEVVDHTFKETNKISLYQQKIQEF